MQEKAVFDDKDETQYVITDPLPKHPLVALSLTSLTQNTSMDYPR
ncbi:hypothetical protein AB6D66_26715 [Vibrio pomeroyi]|uniref:Uncharacterized protein n=2 Tax=Vibrio TaxID=662 RepID=A0ABV4N594_9VIBR|nr:hypothetical protein [Vibrio sp. ED004]